MVEARPRWALALGALFLIPALAAATGTPANAADPSCVREDQRVALVAGGPADTRVATWLCGNAADGAMLLLASPTGISDHSYWDWPQDPATYSFVHRAVERGHVVLNYDRVGTGASDRPPAALVTVESEAFVLHQLVQRAKAGEVGGVAFGRVVLLGNSLSTFIQLAETEIYGDADGLVNTGILIGPRPQGLVTLMSAFYPAQLDPKFAGRDDIPLGYATTQPGTRAAFFYAPTADPATIALDEALKDTATAGEAATFPTTYPLTRAVGIPVLSVVGDRDVLFCDPRCATDGIEAQRERLFWSDATCFELELVPDAGHFLQLHAHGAVAFDATLDDWLARRVGSAMGGEPKEPCR